MYLLLHLWGTTLYFKYTQKTCWKFKHSHKILPRWEQRFCTGTSKCWHTNRCIHIYTAAFQQKDCSPKGPQSEKRKEEGCTALSQTGHAPLLQPQRQPALISKSVFLQVLSSPSPHLWEHHPNSCTASWAAATSGVWAWATPAPALPQWQCHQPRTKDSICRAQDATREF